MNLHGETSVEVVPNALSWITTLTFAICAVGMIVGMLN